MAFSLEGDIRDEKWLNLVRVSRSEGPIRVCMAGDSHIKRMWKNSIGEEGPGSAGTWCRHLNLWWSYGKGGATMDSFHEQVKNVSHQRACDVVIISIGGNDLDTEDEVPNKEVALKIFRAIIFLELSGITCFFLEVINRFSSRSRPLNVLRGQIRSINGLLGRLLGSRFIKIPGYCHADNSFRDKVHLHDHLYKEVAQNALYHIIEDLESGLTKPSIYLPRLQHYLERHGQ